MQELLKKNMPDPVTGKIKNGFPPFYDSKMRGKIINIPDHIREAIRHNGGSAWVRSLIQREIDSMTESDKNLVAENRIGHGDDSGN